jgi:membrane associated rhomboid family serine protease
VLGAYLVLFPHARILALVPLGFFTQLTEVPAVLFLPLWFLLQLLYGLASLGVQTQLGGGVAFWAHVGGFVAGVLLVRLFVPRRRRW